jgi:hypothetical protein
VVIIKGFNDDEIMELVKGLQGKVRKNKNCKADLNKAM